MPAAPRPRSSRGGGEGCSEARRGGGAPTPAAACFLVMNLQAALRASFARSSEVSTDGHRSRMGRPKDPPRRRGRSATASTTLSLLRPSVKRALA